ncbi:MAG: family 43 glycosylhydrolase [Kiritimatiellae bacterium]|jgi:xylan 1,4-beta-xylosidase|nr:family 43 glycosylhydrolase [Kiritimatiellia bacterium]
MRKTYCNPINLDYRFQPEKRAKEIFREAADPSIIFYDGYYWMFISKSKGYYYSKDMRDWSLVKTSVLPLEDYAPDVREVNGKVWCTASRTAEPSPIYVSDKLMDGDSWKLAGSPFPWHDPHHFQDVDGRVYAYWGCSNKVPIRGVEFDAETLEPVGDVIELFGGNTAEHGWERTGVDNSTDAAPFIEGPWVTKYDNKYYMQYAGPGTEWNVYADGVYIAESPLGPYEYQKHNPYSLKLGGFINGAGHGSTFNDSYNNYWHTATMSISMKFDFERRIGIWPAGFDADGVMFCNCRFGDYPTKFGDGKWNANEDSFAGWMLLSYKKPVTCSSENGAHASNALNEDIHNGWIAESCQDEWLQVDLQTLSTINSIQVNFGEYDCRFVDDNPYHQYEILVSCDGKRWDIIVDKSENVCDVPHDYIEFDTAVQARYVKISIKHMPAGGKCSLYGLRVFGKGSGTIPVAPQELSVATVDKPNTALFKWTPVEGASGYNLRWGIAKDKLYSDRMIYDDCQIVISSFSKNTTYYIAVEAFNENGISELSDFVQVVF